MSIEQKYARNVLEFWPELEVLEDHPFGRRHLLYCRDADLNYNCPALFHELHYSFFRRAPFDVIKSFYIECLKPERFQYVCIDKVEVKYGEQIAYQAQMHPEYCTRSFVFDFYYPRRLCYLKEPELVVTLRIDPETPLRVFLQTIPAFRFDLFSVIVEGQHCTNLDNCWREVLDLGWQK